MCFPAVLVFYLTSRAGPEDVLFILQPKTILWWIFVTEKLYLLMILHNGSNTRGVLGGRAADVAPAEDDWTVSADLWPL